jgi:hypothetical protein
MSIEIIDGRKFDLSCASLEVRVTGWCDDEEEEYDDYVKGKIVEPRVIKFFMNYLLYKEGELDLLRAPNRRFHLDKGSRKPLKKALEDLLVTKNFKSDDHFWLSTDSSHLDFYPIRLMIGDAISAFNNPMYNGLTVALVGRRIKEVNDG